MSNKLISSFNLEDLSQIVIGAFALAVPVAFSEEAWKLGESLPVANLLLVAALSVGFLSVFTYQSVFQGNIIQRGASFLLRIVIAYLVTLVVTALVLTALNKFPLGSDLMTAFRRLIVVAMPASVGAIVVDSLDKE